MRLNKVVITDFGPYRNRNEIDLKTTPESPIVLFGGKNGAGKTTLFKSIQIALHGRSALGSRTSEKEYKDFIRSRLHNYQDGKSSEASIRIEFEYAQLGDVDHYVVERSWRDRGKSIVEDLEVRRNGNVPTDLDEDQWEDFLKDLVPPGISQLFFFDGEKVKELATAIEDDDQFENSLFSLLGLDLVDRLDADLSIYMSRKLDESGIEEVSKELENLRDEKKEYEEEKEEIEEKKLEKEEELEEVQSKIEQKEARIAQEGGSYADKREDLKEKRAELEANIENYEEDIRETVTDAYPFALAPDLCQNVVNRLKEETEKKNKTAAIDSVADELDDLLVDDDILSEFDLSEETGENLSSHVKSALKERVSSNSEVKLADKFSEDQRQEMYSVVDEALNDIPGELGQTTRELEKAVREHQETESKLSKAPDEDVISPLVEDLNDLTKKSGTLESEIESLNERLSVVENNIGNLEKQIQNKLSKKSKMEDVPKRAELASEVKDVVSEYREELAKEKLRRLEDVLSEKYLSLSNKSDFYEGVEIDEESLDIRIETGKETSKPQSDLSAGERQIFATSLLWALAEISGRSLPFIIDTPLGRLDQDHRDNIVGNFFPEAAHQVIVLSTDTEVDDDHYDTLSDSLSKVYHLDYDQSGGYTTVSEGYFWSEDRGDENNIPSSEEVPQ